MPLLWFIVGICATFCMHLCKLCTLFLCVLFRYNILQFFYHICFCVELVHLTSSFAPVKQSHYFISSCVTQLLCSVQWWASGLSFGPGRPLASASHILLSELSLANEQLAPVLSAASLSCLQFLPSWWLAPSKQFCVPYHTELCSTALYIHWRQYEKFLSFISSSGLCVMSQSSGSIFKDSVHTLVIRSNVMQHYSTFLLACCQARERFKRFCFLETKNEGIIKFLEVPMENCLW